MILTAEKVRVVERPLLGQPALSASFSTVHFSLNRRGLGYWSIQYSGRRGSASECFMTTTANPSFDSILEELARQGVSIKSHNESNQTWFVQGEGIFMGYVVTSDELIELKRLNRLNLYGIRSLG